MENKILILGILLTLLCLHSTSLSGEFSWGGYYKSYFMVYDMPELMGGEEVSGMVNNTLRLKASFSPDPIISFNLAYSISPRIEDPSTSLAGLGFFQFDPWQYRFDDLDSRLYPDNDTSSGNFSIYQNLDRAYIRFSPAFADIYLGRQPIAWGTARVISSTDVVAPYTVSDLDTEERVGVDALRVRVPVGMMSEIDAGYIAGEDFDFDKSAAYLRGQFYLLESDFSFTLLQFRKSKMVGFDLTRALWDAGFWLEMAYVEFEYQEETETGFRASIGSDYSFNDETYGFIEYHFNGLGETKADDYIQNYSKPAYQDGALYLMGQHYLTPGIIYQFSPLVFGSFQAMINLTDPSALIIPSIEYNFQQDVYISGGTIMGLGEKSSSYIPSSFIPDINSEFGLYPDMYHLSIRIYF